MPIAPSKSVSPLAVCKHQPDLPLFQIAPEDQNIPWLIRTLQTSGWMTATELLRAASRKDSEANRRWLRALANASDGQVFSGPGSPGYKRTTEMTHEEYQHYRNAVMSQCSEMKARIIRTDRVFYGRAGIP